MSRHLTEETIQQIIALRAEGWLCIAIATSVGCSISTVYSVLNKYHAQNPNCATAVYTEEQKQRVIDLYKQGLKQSEIASEVGICSHTTVRDILIKAGLIGPSSNYRKNAVNSAKNIGAWQSRLVDAIWPSDIEEIRNSFEIGDRIYIRSYKSGIHVENNGLPTGCRCIAEVIDVSHPRFLRVRLVDNGVLEDILWSDLVMIERQKAEV